MNFAVDYLGKKFENPFVIASSPPVADSDMISRAFDAGWAGVVTKTLIQEPVKNLKNRFASCKIGKDIFAFENIELLSENSPEQWYRDIRLLKKRFPEKIVIGSIMGDAKSGEQWVRLASGCQDAGCDMIELNFSCPHGYPEKGKGSAIGQNPEFSSLITGWIKSERSVTIPIIPKLTGAVADISHIGRAVKDAGADGICAINSFPSIMGFDLDTLKPLPNVAGYTTPGGYSGPGLKPIALRCVSDLVKNPNLPVMGGGGISSGKDAAEFILAGASVLQICTAVMLRGYSVVSGMLAELEEFMEKHKFSGINDFLGAGNNMIRGYSELDMDYSVKAFVDPDKCSGCGKCFVSCRDAAYQAIEMRDNRAIVDAGKCKGCSLCCQICADNAIKMVQLTDKMLYPGSYNGLG
ncbi:MAG: NAD-dependent dihydropyrimidine dehydrogenase subunit PreA [Candidatus Omnitrophota bacterium]